MIDFVIQEEKHGKVITVNEASGFISSLDGDLSIEYTAQITLTACKQTSK